MRTIVISAAGRVDGGSFLDYLSSLEAENMGYEFTLTFNRKVTDEEIAALLNAGCDGASVSTVPYPTGADPDLMVTQFDFDDNQSSTLEAAITVALEAVKTVPDLSVATFSAPAQPNGMPPEDDDWADLDEIPAIEAAISTEETVETEETAITGEQQESAVQ